jgi:hypothetical protein
MQRSLVPVLAASLALAAALYSVVADAQHADERMPFDHGDHGGDVPPPYAQLAVTEAHDALVRCALRSPFDEATLRVVQVVATLTPPRIATLAFASAPTGGQGRALTRCITAALTPILRRSAAEPSQTLSSVASVYPELDLPMDPPPSRPTQTISAANLAALRARLSADMPDWDRLGILGELETGQLGIGVTDAVSLLSAFSQPVFRREAAARLCRVAHGARVLALLSRPLVAADRTWLRQVTRGRCGVSAPPPPPPVPPVPPVTGDPYACTTSADCALVCNAPPDCCGSPCGCSHAMRREHAAAAEAQCQSAPRDPGRCPAMGCAYRQFTAVCRAGRCAAVEGHGIGL